MALRLASGLGPSDLGGHPGQHKGLDLRSALAKAVSGKQINLPLADILRPRSVEGHILETSGFTEVKQVYLLQNLSERPGLFPALCGK